MPEESDVAAAANEPLCPLAGAEPDPPEGVVEPLHLVFVGVQTVARAEDVRDRLRTALDSAPSVLVDCRGVEEADLTLVQLLLAARRSAARRGLTFRLVGGATGALARAVDIAGIDHPGATGWCDPFWSGDASNA